MGSFEQKEDIAKKEFQTPKYAAWRFIHFSCHILDILKNGWKIFISVQKRGQLLRKKMQIGDIFQPWLFANMLQHDILRKRKKTGIFSGNSRDKSLPMYLFLFRFSVRSLLINCCKDPMEADIDHNEWMDFTFYKCATIILYSVIKRKQLNTLNTHCLWEQVLMNQVL